MLINSGDLIKGRWGYVVVSGGGAWSQPASSACGWPVSLGHARISSDEIAIFALSWVTPTKLQGLKADMLTNSRVVRGFSFDKPSRAVLGHVE
jgi:hypothetical protein